MTHTEIVETQADDDYGQGRSARRVAASQQEMAQVFLLGLIVVVILLIGFVGHEAWTLGRAWLYQQHFAPFF